MAQTAEDHVAQVACGLATEDDVAAVPAIRRVWPVAGFLDTTTSS
jgi:hypothetical protein